MKYWVTFRTVSGVVRKILVPAATGTAAMRRVEEGFQSLDEIVGYQESVDTSWLVSE